MQRVVSRIAEALDQRERELTVSRAAAARISEAARQLGMHRKSPQRKLAKRPVSQ